MPPGWIPVPCRVTPAARQIASSRSALLGGRVEPAERRHDVLARFEEPGHDVDVGEDGAVDDAVRVEGQEGVDVSGGRDPYGTPAGEGADVDPFLSGERTQQPDLKVRMVQDPFDGGRPTLPVAHCTTR